MIFSSLQLEEELWNKGFQCIAGVDEVGRGCFAGPVVTAAVVFPPGVKLPVGIADSKLLSPAKRQEFSETIKKLALCWAITEGSMEDINTLGIGKTTQKSFLDSLKKLSHQPDFVLIDAFWIVGWPKDKQRPIAKGDQISSSIAAASIIAKVYRDELMTKCAHDYPEYGFEKHKGYGTKEHQHAIKEYGLCPLHRTSFNILGR